LLRKPQGCITAGLLPARLRRQTAFVPFFASPKPLRGFAFAGFPALRAALARSTKVNAGVLGFIRFYGENTNLLNEIIEFPHNFHYTRTLRSVFSSHRFDAGPYSNGKSWMYL
jgi:hypothetical protein